MTKKEKHCPSCKKSWRGKKIPKAIQKHYSPPYYFGLQIGIYDQRSDQTEAHVCPFCWKCFDRWTGKETDRWEGVVSSMKERGST